MADTKTLREVLSDLLEARSTLACMAQPQLVALDRAVECIEALAAQTEPVALHIGNLPTVNQDEYPGLGQWWVQLWDGDNVVARVYGDTPHAARAMAERLAAQAQAEPVPTDPDFRERTNADYAAWCSTFYQPDSLDELGMRSLDGLWAWQEQERRKMSSAKAQADPVDAVAWWVLVQGAAASLEDASACLSRDPDAKRAADGAAKHYREAAANLYNATPKTQAQAEPVAVPNGRLRALEAAVSALYFDDSSDFRAALGSVIRHLDERLAGDMLCHPKAAFDRVQAMLAAPQPAHPERQPLTDEQIRDIVREAGRGSALRRDGNTSLRIARAIERAHGIGAKGGAA